MASIGCSSQTTLTVPSKKSHEAELSGGLLSLGGEMPNPSCEEERKKDDWRTCRRSGSGRGVVRVAREPMAHCDHSDSETVYLSWPPGAPRRRMERLQGEGVPERGHQRVHQVVARKGP